MREPRPSHPLVMFASYQDAADDAEYANQGAPQPAPARRVHVGQPDPQFAEPRHAGRLPSRPQRQRVGSLQALTTDGRDDGALRLWQAEAWCGVLWLSA
jgi:hypothetical protein